MATVVVDDSSLQADSQRKSGGHHDNPFPSSLSLPPSPFPFNVGPGI